MHKAAQTHISKLTEETNPLIKQEDYSQFSKYQKVKYLFIGTILIQIVALLTCAGVVWTLINAVFYVSHSLRSATSQLPSKVYKVSEVIISGMLWLFLMFHVTLLGTWGYSITASKTSQMLRHNINSNQCYNNISQLFGFNEGCRLFVD